MPDQVKDSVGRERSNWITLTEPPVLPGWRCLAGAVIRAHGEEGLVDLAALHPAHGVALVGFLDENEEGSPEEASDALRLMLREERFEQRFPGELPIVALLVPRDAHAHLAAHLERSFADHPPPTVPAGWSEWLAERLIPPRPALAELPRPRLVAPARAEAESQTARPEGFLVAPVRDQMPDKAETGVILVAPPKDDGQVAPAGAALIIVPSKEPVADKTAESALPGPEEPPVSAPGSPHRWLDWGMSLGFALGIVIALMVGLALVSRNGRLF